MIADTALETMKMIALVKVPMWIAFSACVGLGCFANEAFCQSDAQYFAEGRIAFDKYKNCQAAETAFSKVTSQFRANPAWIMYMGRTEECLNKFDSALTYYKQYDSLVPGNAEVINKIGDLLYKQQLKADQDQAQHAAAEAYAEQQRQQALDAQRQQQQQAIQAALELAAARGNIGPEMSRLAQLLEANFKIDETITDTQGEFSDNNSHQHIVRHVTNVDHCTLTFTSGDGRKAASVTLNLAGVRAEIRQEDGRYRASFIGGERIDLWGSGVAIIAREENAFEIVKIANELSHACAN